LRFFRKIKFQKFIFYIFLMIINNINSKHGQEKTTRIVKHQIKFFAHRTIQRITEDLSGF